MSLTINALRLHSKTPIKPGSDNLTANLAVESVELPEPEVGEVLVQPLYVGICGSDNSASLAKSNFDWVDRPRTIGHECSGRILAFGPDTENCASHNLKVGDEVCIVPMRGCGDDRCRGCRRGRPNYCRKKKIFGFHRDGAMAEKMVVNVGRCMPLDYGLTASQGAVAEPLSVAVQGIYRKCDIRPGMDVVVSGCGIIGMMSAELARAAGARVAVTGLENDRNVRLKVAQERGFVPIVVSADKPLHQQLHDGIDDLDGKRFGDDYENGTVDVLIECSGAPPALGNAGLSVQLEGTVCVIATFGSDVTFQATPFVRSGQVMTGVMGSNREDFKNAQTLLANGVFPVDVYSKQYEFADAMQAMHDSISAQTTKAILKV